MKKIILCFVTLLAVVCLAACTSNGRTRGYELAFITDIGQLNDGSFNQGTWEGVKGYAEENGKTYKYYQPANGDAATDDDRYDAMKAACDNGAKVVVAAGFMQGSALEKAAKAYPGVKFVFVDGWTLGLNNVTAVVFKEEQSGYLAGYAAVMEGYTSLGYTGGGGGTNPACLRYGYGFLQGANDAAKAKGINVTSKYSFLHGSAFSASPELKAQLTGWYTNGVQVIFCAGGAMCQSAFAAAAENSGKVIGVDVDQSGQSNTVITSGLKGLTEATKQTIAKFYEGKWDSELANKADNYGAERDAVGLPTATWSLTKWSVSQYNDLMAQIKAGSVTIDGDAKDVAAIKAMTFSNLTVSVDE